MGHTNALTHKRKYLNGGVGKCIANRGTGKTLVVILLSIIELMRDATLEVYSNVHINFPRCHYTPSLFLPFNKLKNIIVIIDDCSKLEHLSRYAKNVSNKIRKIKGDMIFIGQYAKQVVPEVRNQYNYNIQPYLNEKKDYLDVSIRYDTGDSKYFRINNPIQIVKSLNLYDTKEIVPWITERQVVKRIAQMSTCERDIEGNLSLYTGDKKELKSLKKEILNHPKYKGKKNSNDKDNILNERTKEDIIKDLSLIGFKYRDITDILGNNISQISKLKKRLGNVYFDELKKSEKHSEETKRWALDKLIKECNLKRILP